MTDWQPDELSLEEARFARRVRAWTDSALPAVEPASIAAVAIAGGRSRGGFRAGLGEVIPGWPRARLLPSQRRARTWLALAVALALAAAALVGFGVASRLQTVLPAVGPANGLIAIDGRGTITLVDPDAGTRRSFGPPDIVWRPVFSPDGRRLAYWSAHPIPAEIGCRPPVDPPARERSQPSDTLCDLTADLVFLDPGTLARSVVVPSVARPGAISWSPDGSSIAFGSADGIAVAGVAVPGTRSIGLPGITSSNPEWSPDGSWIAYRGGRYDDERGVWLVHPDGSGDHRITDQPEPNTGVTAVPHWSPDGRRIVSVEGGDGNERLFVLDMDGANRRTLPTTPDPGLSNELWPSYSPDGTRIAYLRGDFPDCCDTNLRVIAADGSTETVINAVSFGYAAPVWSPDGTRIALTLKSADSGQNDGLAIVDPAQAMPVIRIPATDVAFVSWQRRPDLPTR